MVVARNRRRYEGPLHTEEETEALADEMEAHVTMLDQLEEKTPRRSELLLQVENALPAFIKYTAEEIRLLTTALGERELGNMRRTTEKGVHMVTLMLKHFRASRIRRVYLERFEGKIKELLSNRKRSLADNHSSVLVFADIYRQTGAMVSNVWARRSINEYYDYHAGVCFGYPPTYHHLCITLT